MVEQEEAEAEEEKKVEGREDREGEDDGESVLPWMELSRAK